MQNPALLKMLCHRSSHQLVHVEHLFFWTNIKSAADCGFLTNSSRGTEYHVPNGNKCPISYHISIPYYGAVPVIRDAVQQVISNNKSLLSSIVVF